MNILRSKTQMSQRATANMIIPWSREIFPFEIVSTHMPVLGHWICLLTITCPLGQPELHENWMFLSRFFALSEEKEKLLPVDLTAACRIYFHCHWSWSLGFLLIFKFLLEILGSKSKLEAYLYLGLKRTNWDLGNKQMNMEPDLRRRIAALINGTLIWKREAFILTPSKPSTLGWRICNRFPIRPHKPGFWMAKDPFIYH